MIDIDVSAVDSVWLQIHCERSIARELSDHFTFKVPGYKFMPAYRSRLWNGEIHLFNVHTQLIYCGLLDYVIKFAKDRDYSISVPFRAETKITEDMVATFVEDYLQICVAGKPVKPHQHQIAAILRALQTDRCLLLSPTGSGKSLIIYTIIRYYLDKIPKDKKMIILVPTVSLVQQMYSDFRDYSSDNGWDVEKNCYKITAGESKGSSARVFISTWQSVYKQPEKYFDQFAAVFGDECLDPNTTITMSDGSMVEIKKIKIGDMVKTVNEDTNILEDKPVLYVHKNISLQEQMYEVKTNDGKILKITGNHKVRLKTGVWKRTDELKIGDVINNIEGVCPYVKQRKNG